MKNDPKNELTNMGRLLCFLSLPVYQRKDVPCVYKEEMKEIQKHNDPVQLPGKMSQQGVE